MGPPGLKRRGKKMRRHVTWFLFALLFSVSASAAKVPEGEILDGVEPGPDGMIDILTVFAHQDDESIYGGGAVLKAMKDERVRLYILCLTLGDMSEAKDHLGISMDHLGRIRSEELETAAAVYGAQEVIQFSYHDQGLESADQERLIREIKEVIERVGAEIVITHDPPGVTLHPDHITCSRVATEAFKKSSAKVLYYPTLPGWAYRIVTGMSPFEGDIQPATPTFRVNIKDVKKLKKMAIYAHASQMHFSDVGFSADMMLLFDYEHYTLADSK
jgi:LmbE family N-acetylglucosaminyl deacetylase